MFSLPKPLVTLIAILSMVGSFACVTAAQATTPGEIEYGYEEIPSPNNNGGGKNKNSNSNGSNQSNGGDTTSSSSGDGSYGTGGDSTYSGGNDSGSNAKKLEKDKKDKKLASALGVEGAEDGKNSNTVVPASVGNTDDGDGGSSSVLLIIGLVIVAAAIVGGIILKKRREGSWSSFIGVLMVLAVMVGLLGLGSGDALAKRASAPKGFFGMVNQDPVLSEAEAERMVRGGVETYRLPIAWSGVESSPGVYNWAGIDQEIRVATNAGLKVLPFVYHTPHWAASKYTKLPISTSKQKRTFQNFLTALVGRYGTGGVFWDEEAGSPAPGASPILTWQIWNEANFHYFAQPVSPPNYTKLLKMSANAIRAADPRAKIMMSGLYGRPKGPANRALSSDKFVARVLKLGGKRFMDSVALHPYTPNTQQLRLLTDKFRKALVKNGGRSLPTHITELGWGSGKETVFGMRSERGQAKQLKSGYNYLISNGRRLKLRSTYWFALKDRKKTCSFCASTGLFKAGKALKPKTAWNTFVALAGGRRN